MSYLYILCTILLTVYGQSVIKWKVLKTGIFPEDGTEKKSGFCYVWKARYGAQLRAFPFAA